MIIFPILLSAINLKQVEVEFNSASLLDEDAAADIENYTLEDVDGNEIELVSADVDSNKVVLTIKDGDEVDNQTNAVLTIDKAVLGKEYEAEFEFLDLIIPKVVGAKVIGEDTVKVIFSEPIAVADKDDFEIDGGDYFIKDIEFVNNRTEINVKTYSSFDSETISIEVGSGIEDFAGLNVLSKTLKVVVPDDKEAPKVVGYKDASRTSVTLIFDEDIQLTNDADVDSFYHTNDSNKVDTVDGNPDVKVDGAELTLNFKNSPLPEGTAYVYIKGKVVADLFGNVEKNVIRVKVEVTIDTVKPEIKKVEATAQDTIVVTFTEDVENGAEDEDNYTIIDSDGDEVKDIVKKAVLDDDKVTLILDEELDYGKYTLIVENVEDLAGNRISKASVKFDVKDTTPPEFPTEATLYTINEDKNEYKIVVKFDEAMAVDGQYSVVDLDNYKLNGKYLSQIDDMSDVSVNIKAIDKNKAVEIQIKGYEVTTSMKMEMARVADAAGNKTVELSSGLIDLVEGSNVGFSKVEAIDSNKIRVKFNDSFANFDGKDLAVYYSNNPASDFFDEEGDLDLPAGKKINISRVKVLADNEIELTLDLGDDELDHTGKYNNANVYVVVVNNKSVNKYNKTLEIGAYKVADDKIAPEIEKVTATAGKVTIFFTEEIDTATVSVVTFEVEDETVKSINWTDESDGKATTLELILEDAEAVVEAGTKVTQKAMLRDANQNAVSDLTAEVE